MIDSEPAELARELARGDPAGVRDRLAALLMAADESFFYADLADGSLTWSRGVEVDLGRGAGTVARTLEDWLEWIHPDDRDRLLRGVRTAASARAGVWTERLRVARTDATYATVRVRAVMTRPPGLGTGLVGAMTVEHPLDERDELRTQIEQLRSRLEVADIRSELLVKAVSDATYEWDPATDTVTYNDGMRRLFGHDVERVVGAYRWWIERVQPDDQEGLAANAARFRDGGPSDRWVAYYRFCCADGRYVRVEDHGYAIGLATGASRRVVGALKLRDDHDEEQRPVKRVSPRQAEVLDLVRAGMSNKQIGGHLGISEQAVKDHVSRLLERFGVPNRAALVAAADAARIEVS